MPLYYLPKPGQAGPYIWFPYVAFGVIIVAVTYSIAPYGATPASGRESAPSLQTPDDYRLEPQQPRGARPECQDELDKMAGVKTGLTT